MPGEAPTSLKVALDSNRYTDLCQGDLALAQLLEEAEEVFLPFAVLAELRAGFAAGSRGRENEEVLQRFLRKPGIEVLYPGDTTTRYLCPALPPAPPPGNADPDQ